MDEAASLAPELLGAGRHAEALEVVTAALRERPDDPRLLIAEGRAWMAVGDLVRAQASLLRAAREMPTRSDPFRWLGEVLLKRGDPQRAEKVLERAVTIDPHDPVLARLRERAGRLARIGAVDDDDSDTEVAHESADARDPRGRGVAAVHHQPAVDPDAATTMRRAPPPAAADDEIPTSVVDREALERLGVGGLGADGGAVVQPHRHPSERPGERDPFGTDPFATEVRSPRAASESPRGMEPPARGPAAPSGGALDWPGVAPPPGNRGLAQPPLPIADLLGVGKPRGGGVSSDGGDWVAPLEDQPTARARSNRPPQAMLGRADPEPAGAWNADFGEPDANAAEFLPSSDFAVESAADMLGGAAAGTAEDVDGILDMLQRQRIFEAPAAGADVAAWMTKKQARAGRVPVGKVLAVVWAIALVGAGGGYFGWHAWVDARHEEGRAMVATATGQALAGDHRDLVDAERNLRLARDLDPNDTAGSELLIFVHAQRALEDGAFEPAYLRPALDRGRQLGVAPAYLKAGEFVLAAAQGDMVAARREVAAALEAAPDDPRILYLAGRVEQRIGDEQALTHLGSSVAGEQALSAAAIALAEAKADEGARDEAVALIDGILARNREHLRATLWKAFLTADDADVESGLAAVDQVAARLEVGAPTDRVLSELARARLLRRKGDSEAAATAVTHAVEAGATEPRLLALVASEAKALGSLGQAQQAAMQAVGGAPTNADFRKLLAEVLIERRNGVRALETLRTLSMDDPAVLTLSARAALLVGTPEALAAAAEALGAFVEGNEDPSVEARALHLTTLARVGGSAEVLAAARALAEEAAGDPNAALALGEAALAVGDSRTASEALGRLVQAAPEDAEGHYLLGRANRMANDAEEAEASFRRAIELAPEHTAAKLELGRLLLDSGMFSAADELYQALASESGVAGGSATALLGRLGRVEALIGLGRLDDAGVQLDGVRSQDRERDSAKVARARLAFAQRRPGEAVAALRPLVAEEGVASRVVVLFADALLAAGEVPAATEQYDRALVIDGALPEAHVGKARVALASGDFADAYAAVDRALGALRTRLRPPSLRAEALTLLGRARLLDRRAPRGAARQALTEAVAIDGAPAEAYFFLGEALRSDGDSGAADAYQRYLQADPDGPFARQAARASGG